MAYAIIRSGGKQFRVEEGATVRVPSLDKQAGETVELPDYDFNNHVRRKETLRLEPKLITILEGILIFA